MYKQKLTIKQWEAFLDIDILRFQGFIDPDDSFDKRYSICEFIPKVLSSEYLCRVHSFLRFERAKEMCNGTPQELIL